MPASRTKLVVVVLAFLVVAGVTVLATLAMLRHGRPVAPVAVPVRPEAAESPRIITMSPALAIILRDLGMAGLIVGRDANDMVLDRSLPVCGDQAGLDYEAILRVRPTHIFMQLGARPVPPRLAGLAEQHGWIVKDYPLLTLDDIALATADLRMRVDLWRGERARPATGAGVAIDQAPGELDLAMQRAWSKRGEGFAGAGRVLLLESIDPPAAFGPGSFHQQILERIGGTPAITSGKPFITMDAEDVLRLAPEAIILFGSAKGPVEPTPESLRALLGRLGTLDIPAVKNGRIALIADPLALTPSTAMIGVADEMAEILGKWTAP